MSWYNNYLANIRKTNEEFYKDFAQECVYDWFEDTTLLRNISEQSYPFNDEYTDYQVRVDSVAEVTVNVEKVIGDYISVIFKDCSHTNHRGQKYKYNGETWICYDAISELSNIAECKLLRCNNKISWVDADRKIHTEEAFFGYEISSTNDLISKDGITSNRRVVLLMQGNEFTKNFQNNQRFMIQGKHCYKVEELYDYNTEVGTNGDVTFIKMYLQFTPKLSCDNSELNICDYYNFKIDINLKSCLEEEEDKNYIIKEPNSIGQFETIVTNNGESFEEIKVVWESSDTNIATIDDDGNYMISDLAKDEDTVTFTCHIDGDENVSNKITVKVKEKINIVDDYKIVVLPNDNITLLEEEEIEIKYCVYNNGEKTNSVVNYECSGANSSNYEIIDTVEGFTVKNLKRSKEKLLITFSSIDCLEDKTISIKLNGVI